MLFRGSAGSLVSISARSRAGGTYTPIMTPPTILTAAMQTGPEDEDFVVVLEAEETNVSWAIVGGADAALFTLVGDTLTLASPDYDDPQDADGDNTYVVVLSCTTDTGGYAELTMAVAITSLAGGDIIPPTITSAAAFSVAENSAFSEQLTADETVTWTKIGGLDQALFSITSGGLLTMDAKDYEIPVDSDQNNVYRVRVRATDTSGNFTNQNIDVTVTDVADGGTGITLTTPTAARLRDRVAFGSYLDQAEIEAQGVMPWLENILAMPYDAPLATCRRTGMTWPTGFTPTDYPYVYFTFPPYLSIARIVARKDAIRGMMAEFWANHFVPGSLGEDSPEWFPSDMSRYEYFYRNATGNVRQMIERFICSVSLQHFMTNYLNTASSKNENLGREVLELFGLGLADVDEPPRYDPVFDVLSLTDVLTGHGVRVCPMGLKIDNDADFRQPNLLLQGTTGLQTFYEDDGVTPLAGGKVYFYQPGSTTVAKTVWSNRQKTIAHPNPIVLNGNGQANIFGTGLHAIRVFNSSDVLQYEIINPQSWVGTQHETYWFDATKHDGDAVTFTFLPGVTFSNAVDGAGTTGYGMHPSLTKFLDQLIASRPSARFFVTKIAKFFIGKAPTAAVREALIDKYLEAIDDDDQIAQVLLLLFQTEDFCGTYADNERAMTPLMWWSKLASFFGDDTPHISGGFQLLDRIHEFVETDEGYYTGRYQSPNGYPDTPDHWLSPGNLTGRAFRTNTLTATGVSSTSNYKTKFGFSAPNDFIAFVNVNFLGSRATGAQLDALRASFTNRSINVSNPLNNWSTNSVRAAIREVLNTLPILDIAMLSE